jgi:hypothetical protein
MYKRFAAPTVLGIALFFSQGGNFLVAALCPHFQSGMASCGMQPSSSTSSDEAMSHEDMGHAGHMEMEQETDPGPFADADADAVAMSQSHNPCLHCSVHSSRTPASASLRETEAAKRSIDLSIPTHLSRVAPSTVNPVAVLTSRAHAPPGEPTSRHILINIYRI